MKTQKSVLERSVVLSDDEFHCYEICHTLQNVKGNSAFLVTLYPSYAGHKLDSTTLHIINHMQELGLKQIRIINLFSKIVHGNKMSTRGIEIDTNNMKYIEKIMQEKDFLEKPFILGWGSSLASSLVANQTK